MRRSPPDPPLRHIRAQTPHRMWVASSLVDEFDLDCGCAATGLPGADTQVQLHSHRVGVVGANQGYLDFVVADLFGDRVQARAKELDEVREERTVADA